MSTNSQPKWFLTSKTIGGVIISVLPTLLPALGLSFSADDTQLFSAVWDAIVQLFGAGLAIVGRFKARGPATVLPTPATPPA